MTEPLYYADCHLKTFTAQVLECTEVKGGWQVTLNRTAFYPEGGGQSCDLGTLDGIAVQDVRSREGEIRHLCAKPLEVGRTVTGEIDWNRRFSLMQQHSGEHILSGLVHADFGYHNVGFHMGADAMTIDFDGEISPEALEELESKANAAVYANLPLHIWYPSPEELPNVPYRSKKALDWPVRVVEVPGVDCCACCGVHVASTGEIGPIKIISAVKFKGGVRLELVCGIQAMDYLTKIFKQNQLVSREFSAKMLETGAVARQFSQELSDTKFRLHQLEDQLFEQVARDYAGRGDVALFYPDLTPDGVRRLAVKLMETCGGRAAVFSGTDESGYKYALGQEGGDLREVTRALNLALDGRGGGKPGFTQGSVRAIRAEIEAFLHNG